MREVPWVETSATDHETYDSEVDTDTESPDTTREEMLEALGYR